jgi:hypothetical protein
MKYDVVCAFTNNINCTHVLKKCWLETLPALLGHITLRGADNMASCKLLGKLLYLHTPWNFINDLFCLCRQKICLSNNHDKSWLFLWFQGEEIQYSLRWPYSSQVPYEKNGEGSNQLLNNILILFFIKAQTNYWRFLCLYFSKTLNICSISSQL